MADLLDKIIIDLIEIAIWVGAYGLGGFHHVGFLSGFLVINDVKITDSDSDSYFN